MAAETPSSCWLDVQSIVRCDNRHEISLLATPTESNSIAALTKELNKVKHQLMPAASLCAQAVNEFHEQIGSHERTNASYEFRRARSMCNQYESLGASRHNRAEPRNSRKRTRRNEQNDGFGTHQFVNRSALKLANIDALLGFKLLLSNKHQDPAAKLLVSDAEQRNDKYFSFVDLCGAPGGFSEYILFRHANAAKSKMEDNSSSSSSSGNNQIISTTRAKVETSYAMVNDVYTKKKYPCYGFGMSLIGTNEDGKGASWDLSHLQQYHHSKQSNHKRRNSKQTEVNDSLHYTVCSGSDETGSIYNWDNLLHLEHVIASTLNNANLGDGHSRGLVHLVVADGGFDAQRDSSLQEEVAHRIIVSQTAAALHLLRPGGNFVLKMFGFQMDRTKRMMACVHERFREMVLIKPIVSRPASAERYLVCLDFIGCDKIWDGLAWKNEMLGDDMNIGNNDMNTSNDNLQSSINDILHSFDLQMLELNIESCRSIVNHLNERTSAAQNCELRSTFKQKNDIDLKLYGHSWQLS
ncbi:hypothetical protein ACHAXN_004487 [Cyclotella atomus]